MAQSLLDAYTAAKRLTLERRRHYADTTPWLLEDLSRAAAVFGDDWQPYGLAANLPMLTDFCQGQLQQRLVPQAVDPAVAFADAARLLDGAS